MKYNTLGAFATVPDDEKEIEKLLSYREEYLKNGNKNIEWGKCCTPITITGKGTKDELWDWHDYSLYFRGASCILFISQNPSEIDIERSMTKPLKVLANCGYLQASGTPEFIIKVKKVAKKLGKEVEYP